MNKKKRDIRKAKQLIKRGKIPKQAILSQFKLRESDLK